MVVAVAVILKEENNLHLMHHHHHTNAYRLHASYVSKCISICFTIRGFSFMCKIFSFVTEQW